MTSAIMATGLRKSFGGKVVLDGIDQEVAAGTTFSLLGPDGAGKTTTVHIMSTVVHADGARSATCSPARRTCCGQAWQGRAAAALQPTGSGSAGSGPQPGTSGSSEPACRA